MGSAVRLACTSWKHQINNSQISMALSFFLFPEIYGTYVYISEREKELILTMAGKHEGLLKLALI